MSKSNKIIIGVLIIVIAYKVIGTTILCALIFDCGCLSLKSISKFSPDFNSTLEGN